MALEARGQACGALGICLLCCCLAAVAWRRGAVAPAPGPPVRLAAPALDPRTFEGALREARWRRATARDAIQPDLDAADAADPEGLDGAATEALRRELMARDRCGELARASAAAQRAATLSRTPVERYRASELLVQIDCNAGRHRQELQEARKLVELRPRSLRALAVLRKAEVCNGMRPLR